MKVDALLAWGLIALTICRLALAAVVEVTPTEALQWMEGQRLAPWYLDHGPALPLLVKAGSVIGGTTPLGPRLWNPTLMLLASLLTYLLGRSVCHQTVARWSVVALNLTPWANRAAIFGLEDAYLACGSLTTIWLVWRALHRASPWHWLWPCAGLALGITVLGSWIGLSLFLAIPAALALAPRWRRQWLKPGIHLFLASAILVIFLAALAPSEPFSAKQIIGLTRHRWFMDGGFHPLSLAKALGALILLASPVFFLGLALVSTNLFREARSHGGHGLTLLSLCSAIPMAIGLVAAGIWGKASSAWFLGLPPALILLAFGWSKWELSPRSRRLWRTVALGCAAAMSLLAVNPDLPRSFGVRWPYALDPNASAYGWRESADAIKAAMTRVAQASPHPVFAVAEDPATAAALEFYLSESVPLFRPSPRFPLIHAPESPSVESQHHLWPSYAAEEFRGRNALIIVPSATSNPPAFLGQAFEKLEVAAILTVTRHGMTLREWSLFHGYGYRGLPL